MSRKTETRKVAITYKNTGWGTPYQSEFVATGWRIDAGWVTILDGDSLLATYPAEELSSVRFVEPEPEVDLAARVDEIAAAAKFALDRANAAREAGVKLDERLVRRENEGGWPTLAWLIFLTIGSIVAIALGVVAVF